MRIAICHYHLQRGGVTRIILHTVQALQASGIDVTVIAGEPPPSSWNMPCQTVRELHYDNISGGTTSQALYEQLCQAASHALGAEPDIWHFHNHSLGKNLALPGVMRRLADQGQRLLLQIHDFPEDGRPMNYSRQLEKLADGDHHKLSEILYPTAPHIHYALLNSRDLGFMHRAGAESSTLHLLPNPVELQPASDKDNSGANIPNDSTRAGKRLWLYPTRAIRRKNIGEFLLWAAAVSTGGDTFALTMAPQNPAERPFYENWKALSSELGLPVIFEFASKTDLSFSATVASAYSVVTTSIAEGFGMAFLEPWVLSRPVCGRNLPEITADFLQYGISLPWMYEKLLIPVGMLNHDVLTKRIRNIQADYLRAYSWSGNNLPPLDEKWIKDGSIDFGCLDEEFQAQIIRRLRGKPGRFAELSPPLLPDPGDDEQGITDKNSRLIGKHFSLEKYGSQVIELYSNLSETEPGPATAIDGTRLLEDFLSPDRLSMLRMSV